MKNQIFSYLSMSGVTPITDERVLQQMQRNPLDSNAGLPAADCFVFPVAVTTQINANLRPYKAIIAIYRDAYGNLAVNYPSVSSFARFVPKSKPEVNTSHFAIAETNRVYVMGKPLNGVTEIHRACENMRVVNSGTVSTYRPTFTRAEDSETGKATSIYTETDLQTVRTIQLKKLVSDAKGYADAKEWLIQQIKSNKYKDLETSIMFFDPMFFDKVAPKPPKQTVNTPTRNDLIIKEESQIELFREEIRGLFEGIAQDAIQRTQGNDFFEFISYVEGFKEFAKTSNLKTPNYHLYSRLSKAKMDKIIDNVASETITRYTQNDNRQGRQGQQGVNVKYTKKYRSEIEQNIVKGGCLLIGLLQFVAPLIILIAIIAFLIRSCS